jgi:hypothetical protein
MENGSAMALAQFAPRFILVFSLIIECINAAA